MTHLLLRRLATTSPKTMPGLRILRAIYHALELSRQRRALAQLSDERLRDLGLTRRDVAQEIAKGFWR